MPSKGNEQLRTQKLKVKQGGGWAGLKLCMRRWGKKQNKKKTWSGEEEKNKRKQNAAAAAAKQIWHMYLQLYRSLQRLQSKGLLVLICKSKLFGMSVPPEQRIHFKELRKFVLVQHRV